MQITTILFFLICCCPTRNSFPKQGIWKESSMIWLTIQSNTDTYHDLISRSANQADLDFVVVDNYIFERKKRTKKNVSLVRLFQHIFFYCNSKFWASLILLICDAYTYYTGHEPIETAKMRLLLFASLAQVYFYRILWIDRGSVCFVVYFCVYVIFFPSFCSCSIVSVVGYYRVFQCVCKISRVVEDGSKPALFPRIFRLYRYYSSPNKATGLNGQILVFPAPHCMK